MNDFRITIATVFTLVRLLLIPPIIFFMINQVWQLSFFLFVAAAATDLIDGFLARLLDDKTLLGASLDALADKLLLISCFAVLAWTPSPLFPIPLWFVLFVLIKECVLVVGALFIYIYKGTLEVQPTKLGKCTALMQTLFIIWIFACYFFHWLPIKTYRVVLTLLIVAVGLSLFQYVRIGWRYFKRDLSYEV